MSQHASSPHAAVHAAPRRGFIRKYIFSTDHKVIGIQYLFLGLFSAVLGTTLSMLMRLKLAWPTSAFPLLETPVPGWLPRMASCRPSFIFSLTPPSMARSPCVSPDDRPLAPDFGNFILPIQIGARDMAFPVLNMLSYWTTFVALMILMASLFVEGGAPISGWSAYPPLSALGKIAGPAPDWVRSQTLWIVQHCNLLSGVIADRAQFHHHSR